MPVMAPPTKLLPRSAPLKLPAVEPGALRGVGSASDCLGAPAVDVSREGTFNCLLTCRVVVTEGLTGARPDGAMSHVAAVELLACKAG